MFLVNKCFRVLFSVRVWVFFLNKRDGLSYCFFLGKENVSNMLKVKKLFLEEIIGNIEKNLVFL